MRFTANIRVTRKRTKHGYYLTFGNNWRKFFLHRRDAISALRRVIIYTANNTRLVTANDYAKTTSRPPT